MFASYSTCSQSLYRMAQTFVGGNIDEFDEFVVIQKFLAVFM